MTPLGMRLDHQMLLGRSPLVLYRLVSRRYASLSGLGSALSPGRWNLIGEEAIYTSTEKGMTVLERLVHTPKDRIPSGMLLMTIHLTVQASMFAPLYREEAGPDAAAKFIILRSLDEANWFFQVPARRLFEEPVAIALPSAIVPAWNVVLYPQAPTFWENVTLAGVEPFDYDPRHFPERTPREDETK